ncbi:ABC transporter substrate-binding protein [Marinifilum sp. RC60d5]|uniref:ABC transporter substrate-binding protein n=1 Tax=Marinifilum sp. RC60d5 TaxID=3458414 RepID=UPI0040351607
MSDFIKIRDDLGREISIPFPPKRIISTVPSTTEFLFDLGLENNVISRTRFCRYPQEKIKKLPNIGGPKNLYLDKIRMLNPDLILANEEENDKAQIESLMDKYPVYVSKIRNLDNALNNIINTGKITNTSPKAFEIAHSIKANFTKIPKRNKKIKSLYLIWKDPYISVSKNTFINSMLDVCGFENVIKDSEKRYPRISEEDIQTINPELILLSSEPFPFESIHKEQLQQIVPNAKIELVDGEMFAWYESHLLKASSYFTKIISQFRK